MQALNFSAKIVVGESLVTSESKSFELGLFTCSELKAKCKTNRLSLDTCIRSDILVPSVSIKSDYLVRLSIRISNEFSCLAGSVSAC